MLDLHPNDIEIGERHRTLSVDAVNRLAASMKDIGLRQPITIRIVDEMMVDGHLTAGVPVLVAGAHRLAAAKSLEWDTVSCIEIDDDPVTSELWELSENLHRLDLTKEQRDEHIRRYAELLETRRGLSAKLANNSAPVGRPKSISTEIAEETGLSARTVRRALKPAPEPKNPLPNHDVVTVQFNALMGAWNRAGPEARERFIDEVDCPIFDKTEAAK